MSESRITNHESPAPIHVVAAILRDPRGRILLARRGDGRDLSGLWEFPGGKVEPGEEAEAALQRELREELGIEIGNSEPLIAVPHAYPHKRIRLDVRRVASFRGRAVGREGQALAWVAPDRLASYAMPDADRPVVAALRESAHYLITPEPGADDAAFLAALEAALARGPRRVQLRARGVDGARLARLAAAAAAIATRHRAELLLNSGGADAARIAGELQLGLHLTSADLMRTERRPEGRVAASCHDADELERAQQLGCDFAVLGPLAPTASHPQATALGWHGFAALRERVALPLYALGGLDADDVGEARAHGAQGIAAIRGLWTPVEPAAG